MLFECWPNVAGNKTTLGQRIALPDSKCIMYVGWLIFRHPRRIIWHIRMKFIEYNKRANTTDVELS